MRVLAVDDDPDLLKLISILLSARGHAVETRTSGFGVVNILAGRDGPQPQVCILDNFMPEISGLAILSLIVATPSACNIPIIFHSAQASLREEVLNSGHKNILFLLKSRMSTLASIVSYYNETGHFPTEQ